MEEINAMILDDVIATIKWRLLTLEQRTQIQNEELVFDEIVFDQAVLDAEFLVYKQELIDAENARLAELARVQDIKDRWAALQDERFAVHKAGYDIPNLALELKRIIKENDVVRLAEYEAKVSEIVAEKAAKEAEELAMTSERTLLRNAIQTFKAGTATNNQVQRAIAYILKRL